MSEKNDEEPKYDVTLPSDIVKIGVWLSTKGYFKTRKL